MGSTIKFLFSRDDWYHQRGYWVITNALRNAGLEVVLGGIQTPSEIVETALQEDVDVIGYRIMQGSPKILIPILFDKMQNRGISDIPVIVGGIVPEKDEKLIKKLGVKKVFHPYDKVDSITNQIKEIANEYLAIKMMQE